MMQITTRFTFWFSRLLPKHSGIACIFRMDPHYCIVTSGADKARLLPVMRPKVLMVLHTSCKPHSFAKGNPIQQAMKVNPLSALLTPSGTPKSLTHFSADKLPFKCDQVFANHGVVSSRLNKKV